MRCRNRGSAEATPHEPGEAVLGLRVPQGEVADTVIRGLEREQNRKRVRDPGEDVEQHEPF